MASPLRRKTQTIVLVSLISALIWVYAESQSVKKDIEPWEAQITLPDRVGEMVLTPIQPVRRVELRLTGPVGQMNEIRRALVTSGVVLPIENLSLEAGQIEQINVAELLEQTDLLRGTGVSVLEVNPYRIAVRVDQLETRAVPVEFNADVFFASPPRIEPAEVMMTLPSNVWADLRGRGIVPKLIAETPSDIRTIAPGNVVERSLPLRLPANMEGVNARLSQSAVTVSFEIKDERASITLPDVPIWLVASPSELAAYRISFPNNKSLTDVQLTGPADLIKRIREQELTVIARVAVGYNVLLSISAGSEPANLPFTFELLPTKLITDASNTVGIAPRTTAWPASLTVESDQRQVLISVEAID